MFTHSLVSVLGECPNCRAREMTFGQPCEGEILYRLTVTAP